MFSKLQYDPRLAAEVVIGDEAHGFFNTHAGKYVLRKANEEAMEAIQGLLNCSPEDSERIRCFQDMRKIAIKAVGWLDDAIKEGELAEMEIS